MAACDHLRAALRLGALALTLSCWPSHPLRASTPPAPAPRPSSTSPIDFDREVRPILSDNCFACHGPDDKTRKAGLRLDLRADALKPLKSGQAAIVPGDPSKSSAVARVLTKDADDLMPPPETGKKLSPDQIEKLQRWIAHGAEWPEHWAFRRPTRPAPPDVANQRWPVNDIDRFVLHRLEREGLDPSPEADRPTLARRAALDLTGLPPSIEEVDAFLNDTSPQAYETLVGRLLDSPRYGEHLARYWLDAVRYADSHGYHIDAQRDIWAYRDWVVRAFNQNQPFDQFTTEQLAGDLLPDPSLAQKIATGYLRNNMSTGEGGAIEAEYAAKYAFDRIETTGTVWLGLTLTCARCHTHKYDPIQHAEYFQMLAFFNQLDEPVMDGNRPNPDPFLKLPSTEQAERLAWLKQHIDEAQPQLAAPHAALDDSQPAWMKSWNERLAPAWTVPSPTTLTASGSSTLRPLDDHSILASGTAPPQETYTLTFPLEPGRLGGLRLEALPDATLPHASAARAADGQFRLSEFEAELSPPPGNTNAPQKLKFARLLASSSLPGFEIDKVNDTKPETAWSIPASPAQPAAAWFVLAEPLQVPTNHTLQVRLRFEADADQHLLGRFRISTAQNSDFLRLLFPPKFPAWQLVGPFKTESLDAGFDHAYAPEDEIDLSQAYPGVREEIRWHARGDLEDGRTHLLVNELHGVHGAYYLYRTLTLDAPREVDVAVRADDVFKLWVNDRLVHERDDPEKNVGVASRLRMRLRSGENRLLLKIVNHQGAKSFNFTATFAGPQTLSLDLALLFSSDPAWLATLPPPWASTARDYYRRYHSPEFRELGDNLASWREEQSALDAALPTTLIARELAKPRETRLLLRGEYDKPGEKVEPGVPAILPGFPADAPLNRLGFARWLLQPDHPLTARVTVNRIWQQHFGVGLVKTTEDFGVQGERPFHPELLDWLATEFVRSGWNLKHLHRLIVTSAAYRQSTRVTPELLNRDPENRLLARGPRFRVDAETLRDIALDVSGLLVEAVGGRSVKPFEPPGLWEAVSFNNSQKYVQDLGPANYRRSLYTHWKRQSPPPNMLIFDAPTREFCIVRRPRTNTPLQALALLNDPQFVEAARSLATRMLTAPELTRPQRLRFGFRLATGRLPTAAETKTLEQALDRQLAHFKRTPDAAQKFLAVGAIPAHSGFEPNDLAAWTSVASLLLNLDETLTKG